MCIITPCVKEKIGLRRNILSVVGSGVSKTCNACNKNITRNRRSTIERCLTYKHTLTAHLLRLGLQVELLYVLERSIVNIENYSISLKNYPFSFTWCYSAYLCQRISHTNAQLLDLYGVHPSE
jgi:hypothetical protein